MKAKDFSAQLLDIAAQLGWTEAVQALQGPDPELVNAGRREAEARAKRKEDERARRKAEARARKEAETRKAEERAQRLAEEAAFQEERERTREERMRRAAEATMQLQRGGAGSYRRYLQSAHWGERRAAALKYANHQCQRCGSSRYLQVHHKTYERLGDERLSDLMVLCDACHVDVHNGRDPFYVP